MELRKIIICIFTIIMLILSGCAKISEVKTDVPDKTEALKTNKEIITEVIRPDVDVANIYCFEHLYDKADMLLWIRVDDIETEKIDEVKEGFVMNPRNDPDMHSYTVITRYKAYVKEVFFGDAEKGSTIIIDGDGGEADHLRVEYPEEWSAKLEKGKEYLVFTWDPKINDNYFKHHLYPSVIYSDKKEKILGNMVDGKLQVEEGSIFGECTTPEEIHLMVELAEQGFYKIKSHDRSEYLLHTFFPKVKELCGEKPQEFYNEFEPEDMNNYLSEKWWAEHTDENYNGDDFIKDYIKRWEAGEIWYRYEPDPADEYSWLYEEVLSRR